MKLILTALLACGALFANDPANPNPDANPNQANQAAQSSSAEALAKSLREDAKKSDPDSRLKEEILSFDRNNLEQVKGNLITLRHSDPFIYTRYIPTEEELAYVAKMERAVLKVKSIIENPDEVDERKRYAAHLYAETDGEVQESWVSIEDTIMEWKVVRIGPGEDGVNEVTLELENKFSKAIMGRTIGVVEKKAMVSRKKLD